jgi:hypothetical protein
MRLPRPLWIGMTAVVLIVGTVSLRVGVPIYRQQVAIREIERVGGLVELCAGRPMWLRQRVGVKYQYLFDNVCIVYKGHYTDDMLVHMNSFPRLVFLSVFDSEVTDAGLIHLKRLGELKTLVLENCQVTDAGLVHLQRLRNLQSLSLANTRVTDVGVAELRRSLPALKIEK